MATPPSSTVPLRDPASSRTAECASRCHGEASSARTSDVAHATYKAATPSAARRGTITIMGRLYRQVSPQTIELRVIGRRMTPGSLIDRNPSRYQDMQSAREAFADEP